MIYDQRLTSLVQLHCLHFIRINFIILIIFILLLWEGFRGIVIRVRASFAVIAGVLCLIFHHLRKSLLPLLRHLLISFFSTAFLLNILNFFFGFRLNFLVLLSEVVIEQGVKKSIRSAISLIELLMAFVLITRFTSFNILLN